MAESALAGRVVVITGGTGGIGLHSAVQMALAGARVVVTGRDAARGAAAVQRIAEESGSPRVELVLGELDSAARVDALGAALLARLAEGGGEPELDVLVNNAGFLGGELQRSADGLEMHFAVNVAAVWRLTRALLPGLRRAAAQRGEARVVNVTGGDKPARVDPANLQAEKGFKGLMTYTHSKSCLESLSMVQARELASEKISVHVVFPGSAATAMTQSLTAAHLPGPMKLFLPCFRCYFKDDGGRGAAKAARSTVFASTEATGTGRYFWLDLKEKKLHATAHDPEVQARVVAVIEAAMPEGPV